MSLSERTGGNDANRDCFGASPRNGVAPNARGGFSTCENQKGPGSLAAMTDDKPSVLLVVPPYVTTDALTAQLYPLPYAAVQLAAVLREAGYSVAIKDFLTPVGRHQHQRPASFSGKPGPPYFAYGTPLAEAVAWIHHHASDYDAVGLCAGQCAILDGSVPIAEAIASTGVPFVVGGPFVTSATSEATERFGAHVIVTHEGEPAVAEAFRCAMAGARGMVIDGGKVPDMDALPLPAWDLIDLKDYPKFKGRTRGVLTISRGCPWDCSFCSVFTIMSRKHRRMTARRIKEQLLHLYRAGATYICFLDDNLVINESAWSTLKDVIHDLRANEPGFKRALFYMEEGMEVRVAAHPGIVAEMDGLGFENLAIGLETVNAKRADSVAKPYAPAQVYQAIQNFRAAGVKAKAFYIVGLPGDSVESVCDDLVSFARLGIAARPNNLKLYPGTPMTDRFRSQGIIGADYDWRLSSYHTPDQPGLPYKTVRKLKTVLGAIGFGADAFGLRLFDEPVSSSLDRISSTRGYLAGVDQTDGSLSISGNMFRPTPYRHLAALLMLQSGARGAKVTRTDDGVRAVAMAEPTDDIQAALVAAIRKADEEENNPWSKSDSSKTYSV